MRVKSKFKSILSFLTLCLVSCLSLWTTSPVIAQAPIPDVPPYLVHQGRLTDALNAPINGTQELTFNLYVEETGGTAFWTETQTVLLTEGFYSVTLGQGQSLDLTQFSGATLFLGVTVAGEELTPRLALRSVPYAIKSGVAQNVTGDITPTSITIGGTNGTIIDASGVSVGGNIIIDSSGEWSGPAPTVSFNDLLDRPFTFNDLSCSDGQIPQVVGGAWTCTPASAADTLSGLGCAEGEIPAFVGGVWTCATDADTNTTYAPGTGITITGPTNTVAVDTAAVQARVGGSCAAGLSIRQINADGTVICEDDTDTNTTYAAGAGITITGANNDIAVDTTAIQGRISGSCAANESIRQINADGTVLCESDSDTTYNAAAGGGLILGGGNAFGIGADAITSARIADGAVGTLDLADNAVTSAKIADGNVALADLAANAVDASKILDGAVGTLDLANTSVTTAKLADASVTTLKLVDANVTAAKLADASVTAAKLADGSVNSAKILDGTIIAADINTASVQQRVGGTCAVGSSIRAVAADGTVTCETDDNTVSPYAVGDRLIFAQDAEIIRLELNTGTGYVLMNETSATRGGNVRVGFEAHIQSGADYWAWQITVDGVPVQSGPFSTGLHSSNTASVHAYRRYEVDLAGITPGARIGVHMKASTSTGAGVGAGGDQRLNMKRFRVYSDVPTKEGGVYTAATWRGRMTSASASAIVAANTGMMALEAVEDGNPDVFEVVSTTPFGIRFKRPGHIMWQFDQDIIASGGSYIYIRSQVTNKTYNYTLISPTGGLWDTINNSGVAQVSPNDVLTFEMIGNGSDITSLDSAAWSNLSLFWMGSLDP